MRAALAVYNLLYGISLPFVLPAVKLLSRKRGGFSFRRRFFFDLSQFSGRDVWIHCASIGEVNSVRPLVDRMKNRVAVTTFTDYGANRALKIFKDVPVSVIPPDIKLLTDRFVRKIGAKKLLIYETEVWPSLLYSAIDRGMEVYFVSGKLTERSYSMYKRFLFLLGEAFGRSVFLARSSQDAYRAENLGFSRVVVVGDLKFDSVVKPEPVRVDINGRRPVVVWGSTHEGEEKLAGKVHRKLKEVFPHVLTIVAPRHVGRAGELVDFLPGKAILRTQSRKIPSDVDFYIVDTIGELPGFYAIADVAVVGGTFNEKVGGHNPLEPMVSAVPVVMGPYHSHFEDVVSKVKECIIFANSETLFDKIRLLLDNDELRRRIGVCGERKIAEERGVSERILKEVFS
ncbi:3-deoxy-D-manno-octulosonic acid transferase [Desulfurobacterium sp.]